jgi:hypothetical protein
MNTLHESHHSRFSKNLKLKLKRRRRIKKGRLKGPRMIRKIDPMTILADVDGRIDSILYLK